MAHGSQRPMQVIRQKVRPNSVSGVRKQPRRGRADGSLFRLACTGRAQALPPNPPNIGDDLDHNEIGLLPTVRDPELAAVRARAPVRNRLLLVNRQVKVRCTAMRRRSPATPSTPTGCTTKRLRSLRLSSCVRFMSETGSSPGIVVEVAPSAELSERIRKAMPEGSGRRQSLRRRFSEVPFWMIFRALWRSRRQRVSGHAHTDELLYKVAQRRMLCRQRT